MDLQTACETSLQSGEVKVAREEWRDSEGNLEQYLRFVPEQKRKGTFFRKEKVVKAHWVLVKLYVEVDEEEVGVSIPTADYNAKDWFAVR